MTTIAPRIKKILAIVDEIKAAIEKKGVTVPAASVFGDIPNLISQILTASGATPIITSYFGNIEDAIFEAVYITSYFGNMEDTVTESEAE